MKGIDIRILFYFIYPKIHLIHTELYNAGNNDNKLTQAFNYLVVSARYLLSSTYSFFCCEWSSRYLWTF